MRSSTFEILAGATRSTSAAGIQQVRTVWQCAIGVDLGVRRDAMTHGILIDVAVLQVGDALVPLLGDVALQVRSGDQRLGRVDGQPCLEDEALVTQFVRARDAVIDQEDGDRACAVGDHALGDPQGLHGPDRDGHA